MLCQGHEGPQCTSKPASAVFVRRCFKVLLGTNAFTTPCDHNDKAATFACDHNDKAATFACDHNDKAATLSWSFARCRHLQACALMQAAADSSRLSGDILARHPAVISRWRCSVVRWFVREIGLCEGKLLIFAMLEAAIAASASTRSFARALEVRSCCRLLFITWSNKKVEMASGWASPPVFTCNCIWHLRHLDGKENIFAKSVLVTACSGTPVHLCARGDTRGAVISDEFLGGWRWC